MASVVELSQDYDRTDVPHIVRCAIQLGVLEAAFVLACSLVMRFTSGTAETIALAVVITIGLALVSGLPGTWTRARTIEGIAGAAGIGLAAAGVFLLVDVALLQPIGTYTNRWREIGGFSNWWYHPVWWMVGTYLPWMGAWTLAHQADKGHRPSLISMMVGAIACTVAVGVAAVLTHFPGAGWNLPTFGIAFLPGLALATLFSGIGRRAG
jgi:type IV secretory pathway VirB2 component (pilin)